MVQFSIHSEKRLKFQLLQVATVALAAVASAAPEPQVLVHHTNGAVVPEEPHANKVCSLSTSIFYYKCLIRPYIMHLHNE